MLKFFIPLVNKTQLKEIFTISTIGAFIAGLYGIAHDQITFSISEEYFTKLKFKQFSYADFGLPDRVFAGLIGFLATWWVGFFSAWFISRILIARNWTKGLYRKCLLAFCWILTFALLGSLAGFIMGKFHDGNYNNWILLCRNLGVLDVPSFVKVAYIHNAGYIGAGLGFVLVIARIFKCKLIINHQPNKLND